MSGIVIFKNAETAIRAGYLIESPIPDSEGFLRARTRTTTGWAMALVHARMAS